MLLLGTGLSFEHLLAHGNLIAGQRGARVYDFGICFLCRLLRLRLAAGFCGCYDS